MVVAVVLDEVRTSVKVDSFEGFHLIDSDCFPFEAVVAVAGAGGDVGREVARSVASSVNC